MIFETEISSIGIPRRSNQFLYVVSPTDTVIRTPGIRGLHFSPPYKKIASSQFPFRCGNIIFNPKAEMLRVHDTSAAHSDIYQELGGEV